MYSLILWSDLVWAWPSVSLILLRFIRPLTRYPWAEPLPQSPQIRLCQGKYVLSIIALFCAVRLEMHQLSVLGVAGMYYVVRPVTQGKRYWQLILQATATCACLESKRSAARQT